MLERCAHCLAAVYEHDHFCRQCGVVLEARSPRINTDEMSERPTSELALPVTKYATAPLMPMDARRPVSGSLLKLVTAETTGAALQCDNPFLRRVMMALISLPIWLMIILLSPFDAYIATKAVGARM
jgi:hypothetical protein